MPRRIRKTYEQQINEWYEPVYQVYKNLGLVFHLEFDREMARTISANTSLTLGSGSDAHVFLSLVPAKLASRSIIPQTYDGPMSDIMWQESVWQMSILIGWSQHRIRSAIKRCKKAGWLQTYHCGRHPYIYRLMNIEWLLN